SDPAVRRFSARLSGEETYLRGVNGSRVLPEIAQLEIARAAAEGYGEQPELPLEQVEWLRPVVVGPDGLDLHVELFEDDEGNTGYEILSGAVEVEDAARVIHSHGWFSTAAIQPETESGSEPPAEETLRACPEDLPS